MTNFFESFRSLEKSFSYYHYRPSSVRAPLRSWKTFRADSSIAKKNKIHNRKKRVEKNERERTNRQTCTMRKRKRKVFSLVLKNFPFPACIFDARRSATRRSISREHTPRSGSFPAINRFRRKTVSSRIGVSMVRAG